MIYVPLARELSGLASHFCIYPRAGGAPLQPAPAHLALFYPFGKHVKDKRRAKDPIAPNPGTLDLDNRTSLDPDPISSHLQLWVSALSGMLPVPGSCLFFIFEELHLLILLFF